MWHIFNSIKKIKKLSERLRKYLKKMGCAELIEKKEKKIE